MRRAARLVLICAALGGFRVGVAGADAYAPSVKPLEAWSAAVLRHTPGTVDESVRVVWQTKVSERRALLEEGPAFVDALRHPPSGPTSTKDQFAVLVREVLGATTAIGFVERASTLHADAAMFDSARTLPMPGGGSTTIVGQGGATSPVARSFPTTRDGELTGAVAANWNWPMARALIRTQSVGISAFASTWYHATTAYLFINALFGEADAQLGDGEQLLPNDPLILFDRGCLEEVLGTNLIQALAMDDRSKQALVMLPSAWELDLHAAALFQRALFLDPGLLEGRVRLARLLDIGGKHEDALDQAEQALAAAPSPDLSFLAHLFAARSAMALNRTDAAQRHLDAALALYPRADSALLAASRVALVTGDDSVAIDHAETLVTIPGKVRSPLTDLWAALSLRLGAIRRAAAH